MKLHNIQHFSEEIFTEDRKQSDGKAIIFSRSRTWNIATAIRKIVHAERQIHAITIAATAGSILLEVFSFSRNNVMTNTIT